MMVVFVDFEQDGDDALLHHHAAAAAAADNGKPGLHMRGINHEIYPQQERVMGIADLAPDDGRENPNVNGFSAVLSCYPAIKRIAQSVDLNTLHSLARTCRQFRANLIPYRSQLIKLTLHCENEPTEESTNESADEAISPRLVDRIPRLTTGKVGLCARDMVAECRSCTRVVCRNCCTKPPSNAVLKQRLRRLCVACIEAPLSYHLSDPRSIWPGPGSTSDSFTAAAFQRTPCICEDSVWLCKPCGRSLANDDTAYIRAWVWRSQSSRYLDGFGTASEEGCKCGRGEFCVAAQEIEVEVDCCAEEWNAIHNHHRHATDHHYQAVEGREVPGYLSQEIEGVGGVGRRTLKKRSRIGMRVEEYEDEGETVGFLLREKTGQDRSWCGWCSRVVLGEKDSIQN